jgi:hypothetical protein
MFPSALSIGIAQSCRNTTTTRGLFRISSAVGNSFHRRTGRKALLSSRTATFPPGSTDQDDGVDHIVLLKLKSDVTEKQIQSLKDGASSLVEIDGVESVTIGSMFVEDWMQDRRGDPSINYGIRVRLASKECLKMYQTHPDHVKVIKEKIAPLLDAPVLAYDWVSPEVK